MPPPLRRTPPPPAPTGKSVIERIQRRARRVSLSPSPELLNTLDRYLQLLARWNAKINLTAFRLEEPTDEAIDRLLIEPVVAARHFPQGKFTLIDVGSGSGSPGIPLQLATPAASLTLVESKTRKAVFLSEAVRHLGIEGASVETARFEHLLTRPELHEAFDVLTIRAVRVEPKTLLTLQAFLKPAGQVFWFTGTNADALPTIVPLSHRATYPLLESLRSALVVLVKRPAR
jgi:16S rRNA (guanine527-N7)-methyltransferase